MRLLLRRRKLRARMSTLRGAHDCFFWLATV
jgi:hypothetical protein